mgnify:CR=1 FL=1
MKIELKYLKSNGWLRKDAIETGESQDPFSILLVDLAVCSLRERTMLARDPNILSEDGCWHWTSILDSSGAVAVFDAPPDLAEVIRFLDEIDENP